MAVAAPTFGGFWPEAIQFLADLAANNDRDWFQPRKAEYERLQAPSPRNFQLLTATQVCAWSTLPRPPAHRLAAARPSTSPRPE